MLKMETEVLRAGKIAAAIRSKIPNLVKVGATLYSVVEFIETELKKVDLSPAFPVNISINEIAAHFGPLPTDKHIFEDGDLVKVDFGAHIDGWPVDNAMTIDLGENESLTLAAKEALDSAIEIIKSHGPETTLSEIGLAIETAIKNRGFQPISNLTGHSMEQWELHSGLSILNYDSGSDKKIGERLIAVEPFATTGSGQVRNGALSSIYKLMKPIPQRLPQLRQQIGRAHV